MIVFLLLLLILAGLIYFYVRNKSGPERPLKEGFDIVENLDLSRYYYVKLGLFMVQNPAVNITGIKFPILGDSLYASSEIYEAEKRLCLHSFAIEFTHPMTKEKKRIYSPYCEFIDNVYLNKLREGDLNNDNI